MTGDDGYGFRSSRFCSGGSCVEVAPLQNGWVALRDSKDRSKPEHRFSAEEWADFVRGVKAGDFDFGHRQPAGLDSATIRISR
jgi:hypothetical protein